MTTRIPAFRGIPAFTLLAMLGATAFGQAPPAAPAGPDTPGTGPYPALKEADASLPDHVVYRPANIGAMGVRRSPWTRTTGSSALRADSRLQPPVEVAAGRTTASLGASVKPGKSPTASPG